MWGRSGGDALRQPPLDPTRLADIPAAAGDGSLAALLRAAGHAAVDLPPVSRKRVRARLRATLVGRAVRTASRRLPLRTALALAGVLSLLGAGLGGAAIGPSVSAWVARARPMAAADQRRPDGAQREGDGRRPARAGSHAGPDARRSVAAGPTPELAAGPAAAAPAPAMEPAEAAPVVAPPWRAGPARPMRAQAPSPSSTRTIELARAFDVPPEGGDDARALAAAMRRLRVDGDAAGALAVLDEGAARWTTGSFAPEAAALRVEALLALGRESAALAALEALPLSALPRGDEWRVVRGELRAQAGRWAGAAADFGAAIGTLAALATDDRGADGAVERSSRLLERALWGRAVTLARAGDEAAGRAEAAAYLRWFPHGRFADGAKQLLGSSLGR
jgi:hypothetical protein